MKDLSREKEFSISELINKLKESESLDECETAIAQLVRIGSEEVVEALSEVLKEKKVAACYYAITTLSQIGSRSAIDIIRKARKQKEDEYLSEIAKEALKEVKKGAFTAELKVIAVNLTGCLTVISKIIAELGVNIVRFYFPDIEDNEPYETMKFLVESYNQNSVQQLMDRLKETRIKDIETYLKMVDKDELVNYFNTHKTHCQENYKSPNDWRDQGALVEKVSLLAGIKMIIEDEVGALGKISSAIHEELVSFRAGFQKEPDEEEETVEIFFNIQIKPHHQLTQIIQKLKDLEDVKVIKVEYCSPEIPKDPSRGRKLGEILLAENLVTQDEVTSTIREKKGKVGSNQKIGELLIEKNLITKEDLDNALYLQKNGRVKMG